MEYDNLLEMLTHYYLQNLLYHTHALRHNNYIVLDLFSNTILQDRGKTDCEEEL